MTGLALFLPSTLGSKYGRSIVGPGLAAMCMLLASDAAQAAVVPAQIVVRTGDTPTGPMVIDVHGAVVNDAGEPGFIVDLADGDHLVWVGAGPVWEGSDDAVNILSDVEATMGTNGLGDFVYAPDINGIDGLYTNSGPLAIAGDPAVGHPAGAIYTFHRRPSMSADGSVYWSAGVDLDGGGTDVLTFYRSPDGTPGSIERLLSSGDAVGALIVDDSGGGTDGGIDSDYQVSEDGTHRIHVLNMEGPSTMDGIVWVDGAVAMQEGTPTGGGDNWDNFDLVSINNAGNYLVTGNTDGPEGTDEFVAYNGTVGIREGDLVGGVALQTSASLRFASINDSNQAAFSWGYQSVAGFREAVFFSCNAADLGASSLPVLTTDDDTIDIDGDMIGDFVVDEIVSSTAVTAKVLGNTPFIYAEVDLDDGEAVYNAVVQIPVICCGNGLVDPMEDCDDQNADNTDGCLDSCIAASCGDGFIQAGVETCDDGNDDDTDDCPGTCQPATCGDGFVQAGVEECDDANADDTDDCIAGCVAASCGDGFVQAGVEDCDDQNDDDTDDCVAGCVAASCGDGFVQDGVEECDDGNDDDDDECLSDCTIPVPPSDTGSEGGDTTGGDTSEDTTAGEGESGVDSASTGDGGSAEGVDPDDAGNATDSAGDATGSGSDGGSGSTAGVGDDGGGCGCRTSDERPVSGIVWSLFGLGLLGLRRRRPTLGR
ncbi:MAG: DUF4215 domain-containing protein [Myxococcota bacterium]